MPVTATDLVRGYENASQVASSLIVIRKQPTTMHVYLDRGPSLAAGSALLLPPTGN